MRGRDNPNTLLGQADLVFVNPVGTGFSRPDQPSRGPSFWNSAADTAVSRRVRAQLPQRQRPPEFADLPRGRGFRHGARRRLSGLSRMNTRSPFSGVVLLSMTTSPDAMAGDEQYITLLPSLIMSAWYHKKLSPDLTAMSAEQISGQARQFASREYLHALYKGDRMTAEERTKVVADLSRLTGLSKAFVENNDLRITLDRFNSEIMRDQHREVSPSDARVSGLPCPGRRPRRWRRRRRRRLRGGHRFQSGESRRRLSDCL